MSKPIKLSEIKQQSCYVQCDSHEQAFMFMLHAGLYLELDLNIKATILCVFEDGGCWFREQIIMPNKPVYHIDNIDLNN
jgi:hypothetical protein